MITVASKAERKQSANLSSGRLNNGRPSPSKTSSNDTNNTDSAHNQLISTNGSISSNDTVIAPTTDQQQQQQQQKPLKTSQEAGEVINGTDDDNPNGSSTTDEPSIGRSRGRTLKSIFIQFAGQHLNIFHHHNNNNNNGNSNGNNNDHNNHSWTTPTKQRAQQRKQRATLNQLVEVAHNDLDEHDVDGSDSSSKPVSSYPNSNFLVTFAQKCFHLNFSSSSTQPSGQTTAPGTMGRNCHSCPVTPIKQQQQQRLLDGPTMNNADGRVRPNGCPEGVGGGEENDDKRPAPGGRRSLFASNDPTNDNCNNPSATPLGSKRPQVRFVVESSAEASAARSQQQDGNEPLETSNLNKTSSETSSSSGKGGAGGAGFKQQRSNYFKINKHIRPKQVRAKLNDCAVQTIAARSLLEDQNEFIEDDEERAKLVELLFKLPEKTGGESGEAMALMGDGNCGITGKLDITTGTTTTTTTGAPNHQPRSSQPMNSGQFREHGYRLIDYICNYLDTIRQRRVTPINIEPGYLKSLIKPSAPEQGEPFSRIMHDFENHIMCGITHWQHPHFHAYFPAGNAYPSILADMLSDALGCVGFSWAASPAYTELEIIMLDWMGKMIGLPDEFLCLASSSANSTEATNTPGCGGGANESSADPNTNPKSSTSTSKGGGVIQGSASECVLVSMLAARHWAIDKLRKKYPGVQDGILLTKLIGYCSKEAHSCVEKAAMIGFIRMRALETDDKHSLRGDTLRRAMELDIAQGLEPFIVCATLGTTSCVSFDNLRELGEVCRDHDNLWMHVDAAYAGSALICPEFKYLIDGIELATSFNMNPNKWMLINFDCSLMWVKDRFKLTRAFVVDPLYLQHSFSDQAIDYRHWGIPLSRRFRALKLWFVIRNYGVEGLRDYIRNHVRLAKLFESLIRQDKRFMITNEVVLGLVCFRLIGSNALNQRLLSMLNASGKLHMVPASLNGRYIIRFCVCDQNAKADDIHYAYECISEMASELFELIKAGKERIRAISQQNTIDVSNITLHTQQSASADRLSGGGGNQEEGDDNQQVTAASAGSGQHQLLRRSSTRHRPERESMHQNPDEAEAQEEHVAAGSATASAARSPSSSRSPRLMKQASIRAAIENGGRPISGLSNTGTAGEQRLGELEDLEQEVPIDSLATIDGYDYDLEDNLDEDFLEELQEDQEDLLMGAPTTASGVAQEHQQQSLDEQQLRSIINDSISPIQRGRLSRASGSVRSSSTRGAPAGGAGGEEADEAADELVKLVNRRHRMSLRYKREFFVRVVSDPRVYRASISGDINAHTSSTSSLASQPILMGPQQQLSQQTTTIDGGNQVKATPPVQQQQGQQQELPANDESAGANAETSNDKTS